MVLTTALRMEQAIKNYYECLVTLCWVAKWKPEKGFKYFVRTYSVQQKYHQKLGKKHSMEEYCQQDGATVQISRVTFKRVHEAFSEKRTVSRGCKISWTTIWPDLFGCEILLLSQVKGPINSSTIHTLQDLQQNTEDA